jgi:hypothetical protein
LREGAAAMGDHKQQNGKGEERGYNKNTGVGAEIKN